MVLFNCAEKELNIIQTYFFVHYCKLKNLNITQVIQLDLIMSNWKDNRLLLATV